MKTYDHHMEWLPCDAGIFAEMDLLERLGKEGFRLSGVTQVLGEVAGRLTNGGTKYYFTKEVTDDVRR